MLELHVQYGNVWNYGGRSIGDPKKKRDTKNKLFC